jgi:hypothetical protein
MINEGSTALPYEPYRKSVFIMPFRAGLPDTYGMKIGNVYDSIDWVNMRYIKRIGTVDMGTLNWKLNSTSDPFAYFATVSDLKPASNEKETREGLLCSRYKISEQTTVANMQDKSIYRNRITSSVPNVVFLKDSDFDNNASSLIESLRGEMLYYELATPEILALPSELHALEGYGWGVSDTVYNYVDWKKKQFVKLVGRVDMGTLNWTTENYQSEEGYYIHTVDISDMAEPTSFYDRCEGLVCGMYSLPTSLESVTAGTMNNKSIMRSSNKTLMIRDDDYTDAAKFKSAMSGVMLYYELAEPVITDISELLSPDNMLEVSEGGTVEVVTDYEYMDSVPTKLTYQCKNTIVT